MAGETENRVCILLQLIVNLFLSTVTLAINSPVGLQLPESTTTMRASDYSAVQAACRLFTSDSGLSCGSNRTKLIRIEVFQDKNQLDVLFAALDQDSHLGNLDRNSIIYVLDEKSLRLMRKGYPE